MIWQTIKNIVKSAFFTPKISDPVGGLAPAGINRAIVWQSLEKRNAEWAYAKSKMLRPDGELESDGTKLRRRDNSRQLTHSFIVIDGKLLAMAEKNNRLGEGAVGRVKLAEDESGNIYALKTINLSDQEMDPDRESEIAQDLGLAGRLVRRTSNSWNRNKGYLLYQYLGTTLSRHISRPLTLDERYELCIKIAIKLDEMHNGLKAKSGRGCSHGDIHFGNVLIDDHQDIHFIDFGRSKAFNDVKQVPIKDDIEKMLLLFFSPKDRRPYDNARWILGDWMGEYNLRYQDGPPNDYSYANSTIYLYLDPADRGDDDTFSCIRFSVISPTGETMTGTLDTKDLGISPIRINGCINLWSEEPHIPREYRDIFKGKVLECLSDLGHIIHPRERNPVLFDLLEDPSLFYEKGYHSALDVALIFVLCRFELEAYRDRCSILEPHQKREIIKWLNDNSRILGRDKVIQYLDEKFRLVVEQQSRARIVIQQQESTEFQLLQQLEQTAHEEVIRAGITKEQGTAFNSIVTKFQQANVDLKSKIEQRQKNNKLQKLGKNIILYGFWTGIGLIIGLIIYLIGYSKNKSIEKELGNTMNNPEISCCIIDSKVPKTSAVGKPCLTSKTSITSHEKTAEQSAVASRSFRP